jgi:hypothetical protein
MKWNVLNTALFALLAINVCAQERTGTFFVTADKLAIDSRASNRVADGPVPSWEDLRKSDQCVYYIEGALDLFMSARLWHWSPQDQSLCTPESFNPDQAIRMFVKYADGHPKELNESAPAMLLDALHSVFPCPVGE